MNGKDVLETYSALQNKRGTVSHLAACLVVSSRALSEMDCGIGGAFDRECGPNVMGMSRSKFGDSFERGRGWYL